MTAFEMAQSLWVLNEIFPDRRTLQFLAGLLALEIESPTPASCGNRDHCGRKLNIYSMIELTRCHTKLSLKSDALTRCAVCVRISYAASICGIGLEIFGSK